ncbi:MAG: YicC/YloC family endoribonuclease [Polyangiaceae bacterium]
MQSMTGFGIGEAALGDGRVTLELRALNHRFLDVRVRVPNEIADHGSFIEQLAREGLTRGRFEVGVRLLGPALPVARFSRERARAVYNVLLELRDALAPGTEVPISAVTTLPDLVTAPPELDAEGLRQALVSAFASAVQSLNEMRGQEGDALSRELTLRVGNCRRLLDAIQGRADSVVELHRTRLRERIERLLSSVGAQAEPSRLEAELALIADRSDIVEEVVRLQSHFNQFATIAGESGPVGRRLEFLLQEIGREANTIGAKSQDAPIAHLVVELKAEVERMREQVHNVE